MNSSKALLISRLWYFPLSTALLRLFLLPSLSLSSAKFSNKGTDFSPDFSVLPPTPGLHKTLRALLFLISVGLKSLFFVKGFALRGVPWELEIKMFPSFEHKSLCPCLLLKAAPGLASTCPLHSFNLSIAAPLLSWKMTEFWWVELKLHFGIKLLCIKERVISVSGPQFNNFSEESCGDAVSGAETLELCFVAGE